MTVVHVVVDHAPGPGIDWEVDDGAVLARSARAGGLWLGFDRGHLDRSDDGRGRAVPALVAVPQSTAPGCHIEADLCGALRDDGGTVLVTRLGSGPLPGAAIVAAAAGRRGAARWLPPAEAAQYAAAARRRFRERVAAGRIVGGLAWSPGGELPPEQQRSTTPHSRAEYSLATLPPRYLRGLDGLLDPDERVLYFIERPPVLDSGLVSRLRGQQIRGAVLALTDRQFLWMVDHFPPDRALHDWGVDIQLLPLERIEGVAVADAHGRCRLTVSTGSGKVEASVPPELRAEMGVAARLIARFLPGSALPRRIYPPETALFDAALATPYRQQPEAAEALAGLAAAREEPLLATFFSPARPGAPHWTALGVSSRELLAATGRELVTFQLATLPALGLVLSPLIGKLDVPAERTWAVTYPSPLNGPATAFVRVLRRAWANAPDGLG